MSPSAEYSIIAYSDAQTASVQPSKWLIAPPPKGHFLAFFARFIGLLSLGLCILWIQSYNGGVGLTPKEGPDGSNDTAPVFGWHPILMMLAFAVFMAEAVLTYQAPLIPGITRINRKRTHYTLQFSALVCAILGLVAAFQSHNLKLPSPIPNLYSSHSFLGIVTTIMLIMQYGVGFISYLYPQMSLADRMAFGPIHRFFGIATWCVGLATCSVGFMERSSILQFTKANIYGAPLIAAQLRSPTIVIPACIEVLLVLLALSALYHLVPAPTAAPSVQTESTVRNPEHHPVEVEDKQY